jgi:hypothetical protein
MHRAASATSPAGVAKKADYVLSVKDNQGLRAEQVRDSFLLMACDAVSEKIDCGQGRVERRRCSVIADRRMAEKAAQWASLKGLVRIERKRYHKAGVPTDRSSSVGWKATGIAPRQFVELQICGKCRPRPGRFAQSRRLGARKKAQKNAPRLRLPG